MKTFERMLPGEHEYVQDIVAGILHAQARLAAKQHRPLERGTHSKGICVRGTFTVLDLTREVADPVLRARLSHGLFAHPGSYPATIRFANAASTIEPDYTPDVRALSFAVEVPAGVLGPEAARQDFSLNDATTFAINDAHEFATLVNVLEAEGAWRKLGALAALSPAELWSIGAIGIRGARQKRHSVRPFQRLRYWSGVPFRHGPDEAMKYDLRAHDDNPAPRPARSRDMLRDELVRHVTSDQRMSVFDFRIQLLDADRMRRLGRRRDETYWVENASVEWPETQAPFHTVARLTLEHDSVLPEDACRAFYIDVNEHASPDNHPLGSINRARWYAESASRAARLGLADARAAVDPRAVPDARAGAPLPAPAPARGPWIGRISVGAVAGWGLAAVLVLFVLGSIGAFAVVQSQVGMLPAEPVATVEYPDNGWGAGLEAPDRQAYYYTAQGAGLKDIRYDWLLNLEMPWGRTRIADPAVMRRYGFLVDQPTPRNPDQLPVGFTRHFDPALNEELLDVTCAACHTGQLQLTRDGRTRAVRVDGGQANHAFTDASVGEFLPTLIASLAATQANPLKFNRFARRVLGARYPDGKAELRSQMRAVTWRLARIGYYEQRLHLSPTREGYGRTDALARIANTVFAENLGEVRNYRVGNAPVSFPAVWNIWKFDWVQYNASVSQPMARNIGEAMGVGAKYALVDRYGRPLPDSQRFRSSANIAGLDTIETTLQRLRPPAWPEAVLGPINRARADSGRVLFDQNCVSCHGPHLAPPEIARRDAPLKAAMGAPHWLVASLCADDVGTDSTAAVNFYNARVDISRTGLTAMDLRRVARRNAEQWVVRDSIYLTERIAQLASQPDSAAAAAALRAQLGGLRSAMEEQLAALDPRDIPVGAALSYLGTMIRERAYADGKYTPEQRAHLDGFGTLDLPQIVKGYKARPLAGIWATPPFLHNGSVPTIYHLLSPPAERPVTFQMGSREYDPEKLGLAAVTGYWTFDAREPGNRNTGHEFGPGYVNTPPYRQPRPGLIGPPLTPAQRYQIIEYLKLRDDDLEGPKQPNVPHTCGEVA